MKPTAARVAGLVVVLAAVYAAGVFTAPSWKKGPQADGDPVGFALVTPAPSAANIAMVVSRTLPAKPPCAGPNAPCNVTIEYFATPCPDGMQCALPSCPPGAECVGFAGTAGVSHTDRGSEDSPHEQENLNVNGIVILAATKRPPPQP